MTILKSEPVIKVGIVSAPKIVFVLNGDFLLNNEIIVHSGNYTCSFEQVLEKDFTYSPLSANATFTLLNVKIGIGFHWEQHEDQAFEGELFITKENNLVIAINQVSLEKYLESVISSEMSAMNDLNLLNTHAIVSRSWLLAQLFNKKNDETKFIKTKEETLKWYDREDHSLFDVCADDHCQRYQGITKVISTNAIQAIQETRGLVLCQNDSICDARFSKCCGGISEDFGNAWQPIYIPYLTSVIDSEEGTPMPDISSEQYYTTSPQAYCNTKDTEVLSQILIDFDRDTPDFYRWIVPYSQKTLSELLHKKSGFDFGEIIDLIPLERGNSGRITRLQIIGTKRNHIVGKELEIRKWLSESHLYSSAFIVRREFNKNEQIPTGFILQGAGWGHGVGMCQIGAALMSKKGVHYTKILQHYFKNANITKMY